MNDSQCATRRAIIVSESGDVEPGHVHTFSRGQDSNLTSRANLFFRATSSTSSLRYTQHLTETHMESRMPGLS